MTQSNATKKTAAEVVAEWDNDVPTDTPTTTTYFSEAEITVMMNNYYERPYNELNFHDWMCTQYPKGWKKGLKPANAPTVTPTATNVVKIGRHRFTPEQVATIMHLKGMGYDHMDINAYLRTLTPPILVSNDVIRQRMLRGMGKLRINRHITQADADGWRIGTTTPTKQNPKEVNAEWD